MSRLDAAIARDLLAELVDIPSPSGDEGRIVARLEELCEEWGLGSRRVPTESGRDSLVVGAAEPELVFAAHVDTISPTWPARARVEGDVVHGLGALDDKGGVVACLLAAAHVGESGGDLSELGVAFAFPVDEEEGGCGSRALALALQPRYAVALEATGLRPGIVECGGIDAWVHVRGRSAHGALAELGDNAIARAVELIGALPSLGLGEHEDPLLGASRASIGAIQGGTDFNTVPDRCSLRLEVMIVPGQEPDEVLAELERLAAEYDATVQLVEVTRPFVTAEDSPLVAELRRATEALGEPRPEVIGVPAWTDAHNFVDFSGAEAVVFGPGDFATAHTPEEHVEVSQVLACAEVFAAVALAGWRGDPA